MARLKLLLLLLLSVAMELLATKASSDSTVPQTRSATSSSLTVRVPCNFEGKCETDSLEYKKKHVSDSWNKIQIERKTDTVIKKLDSDTEYQVRTTVKSHSGPTSTETVDMWTCPEELPQIQQLRAAETGPGWLDLRWIPVKDKKCKSNIYYHVHYMNDKNLGQNLDEELNKWMVYGVFNNTLGGEKVFRPTHPCSVWNVEFCLLLTDEVSPGVTYRIFVKPVRDDPERNLSDNRINSPVIANVSAEANIMNTGWYALGQRDERTPCVPPPPPPTLPPSQTPGTWLSPTQDVEVPIWAIVIAGVVLALAIMLFIAARLRQRSSSTKPLLQDAPPAGDSAPCDPRCSNIYDDCLSAGHMGAHTLPADPTTAAQHEEPVYESMKNTQGAQGAQAMRGPLGMQAGFFGELSAKMATKASPVPASNYYVSMNNSQGIYDDIQPTYSNTPGETPGSDCYVDPGSPIYDEASGVPVKDDRKSQGSVGYNRPYSQAKTKPWRGW